MVPGVLDLYNQVEAMNESLIYLRNMGRVLRDRLISRFRGIFYRVGLANSLNPVNEPYYSKVYFAAAIMDPNFKLSWIDDLHYTVDLLMQDDSVSEQHKRECVQANLKGTLEQYRSCVDIFENNFAESCHRWFLIIFLILNFALALVEEWAKDFVPRESQDCEVTLPVQTDDNRPTPKSLKGKYALKRKLNAAPTPAMDGCSHQSLKQQLNQYLEWDHGDISYNVDGEPEEINAILFWTKVGQAMPALHRLAMMVLSVPATSAPVERLFSHGSIILRPHRAALSDSNLENLIFVKCNRLSGLGGL